MKYKGEGEDVSGGKEGTLGGEARSRFLTVVGVAHPHVVSARCSAPCHGANTMEKKEERGSTVKEGFRAQSGFSSSIRFFYSDRQKANSPLTSRLLPLLRT